MLLDRKKSANLKTIVDYLTKVKPEAIIWDFDPTSNPISDFKFHRLMNFMQLDSDLKSVPKISICFQSQMASLKNISTVGDVVHFVKSIEVKDLVYYIRSVLMPESISSEQAARAFFHNKINLFEAVKVKYLAKEHAEIETSRNLENGTEVEIDLPYLKGFKLGRRQIVEEKRDSDTEIGFKWSYKIKYKIDVSNTRPDEQNNLLGTLRYKLAEEKVDEVIFKTVIDIIKTSKTFKLVTKKVTDENMEKDSKLNIIKNIETCFKASIFNFIHSQLNLEKYHFNKVTIYDEQLSSLDQNFTALEESGTFVTFRRSIIDAKEEIKKDRPDVIAIYYDQQNSFEQVKQIAAATTQFRDYFPFIMLFNFKEPDIDGYRHTVQYHFVIGTAVPINESLILRLVNMYRTKRMSKEQAKASSNYKELISLAPHYVGDDTIFLESKISFPPLDPKGLVEFKHLIEIIWMSEFEMVFYSKTPLTIGEIYAVEIPTRFNIVILPHIVGSKEATIKDCYRGLIHFIGESDKQVIRRFVNHISKLSEVRKISIKEEEINEIKLQYF